jgi:hypothetical protein
MRAELEARLREVYPDGLLDQPNEEALWDDSAGWLSVLDDVLRQCPGFVREVEPAFSERVVGIVVTLASGPPLRTWTRWDPIARQASLEVQGGMYPVLWLKISRVWPAVDWHFNLWQRQADTDSMDVTSPAEPPGEEWRALLTAITAALGRAGIERLSSEEMEELVPFVREIQFLETGDDDDEDLEARKVEDTTNVAQCLFQEW